VSQEIVAVDGSPVEPPGGELRAFFASLTWGELQPLLGRALHDASVESRTIPCPAVAELTKIAFTEAVQDAFTAPGRPMTPGAQRRADQAVAVASLLEGILVAAERWLEGRVSEGPGNPPGGPQERSPGETPQSPRGEGRSLPGPSGWPPGEPPLKWSNVH
jgi:hypothetical protein